MHKSYSSRTPGFLLQLSTHQLAPLNRPPDATTSKAPIIRSFVSAAATIVGDPPGLWCQQTNTDDEVTSDTPFDRQRP